MTKLPMLKFPMIKFPMIKFLGVRVASAAGILFLAFLIVGLVPILSPDPSAGAKGADTTPPLSEIRALKGDRLPLASNAGNAAAAREALRLQQGSRTQIPVGCDAAFSPISAPQLAGIYRRCTT
jgi:hypothetical protein